MAGDQVGVKRLALTGVVVSKKFVSCNNSNERDKPKQISDVGVFRASSRCHPPLASKFSL